MTGAFSCDSKSSHWSHLPPVLAAITTSRMGARPELAANPPDFISVAISCKGSSTATSQSPERELLRPNPKFLEFWKIPHPRLEGGQRPTRAVTSPKDFGWLQKTPRAQHTAPRVQRPAPVRSCNHKGARLKQDFTAKFHSKFCLLL